MAYGPKANAMQSTAYRERASPMRAPTTASTPTAMPSGIDSHGSTNVSQRANTSRRGVGVVHNIPVHAKSSPACDPSARR